MILVGTRTSTAISTNLAGRKRFAFNLLLQQVVQFFQFGSQFHIYVTELLNMNSNKIKLTSKLYLRFVISASWAFASLITGQLVQSSIHLDNYYYLKFLLT